MPLKISAAVLIAALVLGATGQASAATTTVDLGNAASFAVLAGSGITNSTGPTTITGDVGSSPTPTETGFGTVTINGTNHNDPDPNDAATQLAKTDLNTAYTDAATRAAGSDIGTDLGGQTLTAGVYHAASGTFSITGGGDTDA